MTSLCSISEETFPNEMAHCAVFINALHTGSLTSHASLPLIEDFKIVLKLNLQVDLELSLRVVLRYFSQHHAVIAIFVNYCPAGLGMSFLYHRT